MACNSRQFLGLLTAAGCAYAKSVPGSVSGLIQINAQVPLGMSLEIEPTLTLAISP
jgi:hypothetical protein